MIFCLFEMIKIEISTFIVVVFANHPNFALLILLSISILFLILVLTHCPYKKTLKFSLIITNEIWGIAIIIYFVLLNSINSENLIE